jgi:hypothetical protein
MTGRTVALSRPFRVARNNLLPRLTDHAEPVLAATRNADAIEHEAAWAKREASALFDEALFLVVA